MHAIFINFGNSKIYNPHRLLLNLSDKLKKSDKYVAFSDLSIYYTWKILKSHTKKKIYQLRHGMKSLNYLMDLILYQIFKTVSNIS